MAKATGTECMLRKREIITVTRDLDLRSLTSLLARNRISGVVVVNEDMKLAGVVSKTDIRDRLNMENLLARERQSLDFDPYTGGVMVFREIRDERPACQGYCRSQGAPEQDNAR
jgi:CBS domain-containing protein